MKVIFVVAASYSPQKVRPEDGRERLRTSNCSVRILAELELEQTSFLHRRTTRNRRFGYRGWQQTRLTSKRRYSWNHGNRRDNRLQSVHRN